MVVPTYPEGGSRALQVCQHHHQVVRVGHFVGLAETQGTWCSRLLRPIRLKPSRYHSAKRALWYREGGGPWPVRPRVRGVLSRRIARWGQIGPNPVMLHHRPPTTHQYGTEHRSDPGSDPTHRRDLSSRGSWPSSRRFPALIPFRIPDSGSPLWPLPLCYPLALLCTGVSRSVRFSVVSMRETSSRL